MASRKSVKKMTKIHSLPVRKDSSVKGGFRLLSGSFSNVMKTMGDALSTMARKQ